jgi:heme/copper-type cytochrome/quinol oxidase subunit 1
MVVGFTLGGLLLFQKGVPLHPLLWRLLPTHVEFLLLGWILQLAMGVAYWILPRSRGTRGREEAAWLAFFLLNVGIWLAGVGPALNASGWVRVAGRLSELGAALAFGAHAWPRVKPLGV